MRRSKDVQRRVADLQLSFAFEARGYSQDEWPVLKTAVDTFERSLTPWVLADACASHVGQETHAAGLLVTRTLIGSSQIITTADLADHKGSILWQGARLPVERP